MQPPTTLSPWKTSIRDAGASAVQVSIYLERPFPKEPSTSSGRSPSNYGRGLAPFTKVERGSRGLTAARISRHRTRSNIKRESRFTGPSYSSISESILVYSRRICRDRSEEVSKPAMRTYIFQQGPTRDRGKRAGDDTAYTPAIRPWKAKARRVVSSLSKLSQTAEALRAPVPVSAGGILSLIDNNTWQRKQVPSDPRPRPRRRSPGYCIYSRRITR